MLPDRLGRRVRALHESTEVGPSDTATNVAGPDVDAGLLAELAHAVRDRRAIRFFYGPGRSP